MSKENILIGDAYFKANPSHILGDPYEKARGDRGGKIEHMVKGTLDSAIAKFEALQTNLQTNTAIEEDCEKVITEKFIEKTLKEDTYYSEIEDFKIISFATNINYKELSFYSEKNPFVTKFNDKVYFGPDNRTVKRDGLCVAWVKYLAHFVTGGNPRKEDKSKMATYQFILPTLKNANNRYIQKNEDGSESIIYSLTIQDKREFCLVVKLEFETSGLFRAITILPDQNCKKIAKKIAVGNWVETATIPLSINPFTNDENPLDALEKDTTKGNTNVRTIFDLDTENRNKIINALYKLKDNIIQANNKNISYDEYTQSLTHDVNNDYIQTVLSNYYGIETNETMNETMNETPQKEYITLYLITAGGNNVLSRTTDYDLHKKNLDIAKGQGYHLLGVKEVKINKISYSKEDEVNRISLPIAETKNTDKDSYFSGPKTPYYQLVAFYNKTERSIYQSTDKEQANEMLELAKIVGYEYPKIIENSTYLENINQNNINPDFAKKIEEYKTKSIEKAISKSETDRKKTIVTATASKKSNGEITTSLMYSAEENYKTLNPEITDEELSAYLHANPESHFWNFKKPTISIEECFQKGLLMLDIPKTESLGLIKTVYVYEYLSGNVALKMNNVQNAIIKNWPSLENNNNKFFTLSQLEFQLSKMQAILPPFKRIDAVNENERIILLPHAELCKKTIIYKLKNGSSAANGISLYNLYVNYCLRNLRSSKLTNGANLEDVQKYVQNKSIRLSEYDKKNLSDDQQSELKQNRISKAKEMGDKLFYEFIEEFISAEDIAIINQQWNSKLNGTVEPNLNKIPVSFPFSKVFKGGGNLNLTTTQRNGVAFSQLNGSSLLGYDVGVGKTLTLIACLSNQFTNGTTKRALLVVPDATFKKWIYEIKGGEDKNGKWVYGALPTANVFAYGNLNIDAIENEVREYSEKEQKQIAFLKSAVEKAKGFAKLIEQKSFNEDAFQKPLAAFITSLQKFELASEYLLKTALANDRVKAALMINEQNNSFAQSFIELILTTLKQDLELAIYTLGKVKEIPENSIVMLNYTGLVRLGFSEESRIKLRSGLYKILSQGETNAKEGANLIKKVDEIIGTTGLNAKINIDDLQIDHLAIDEAHNMKKVFTRVKGEIKEGEYDDKGNAKRENSQYALDSGEPSNQAICAFCMSQYVQKIANGNCTILTATPFTNNPLEVFSMLALTNYRRLEAEEKDNLLEFFNTYIKEETQLVITAQGLPDYKPVITGFNNLPQLRQLIFDTIDYKTGEDAKVLRPEAISIPDTTAEKRWGGATATLQMTDLQKSYMRKIEDYINNKDTTVFDVCDDAINSDELCDLAKQYIDNFKNAKSDLNDEAESTKILRALSWQKLLAVSPYLFACNDLGCPTAKDFVETSPKLLYTVKCIESSKAWHEARKEEVSGSVIYMNSGTQYFPLIKEYLVNFSGFKKEEVELIYGEISPQKKEKIKEDFLEGKVKVIIGSGTIKEGIDLQNKSTSLYIIIPDWNPTDYNQVKGRIWRQGNQFSYVRIINVLMANTADVFVYQKLQEKTQRIKELLDRASTKSQLDLDDVNPEEIKESLITDPKRKAQIQIKRQSREIDAQITVANNQLLKLTDLQSSTNVFNNLHPKVVNAVNEFNVKYAQLLKERDIEEDRAKRENFEAKGLDKEFVSKFDPNAEVYTPVQFDVNDYSEQNMSAINRRTTSMLQRVRENEVFINGLAYYVLQELVTNWREVRARFLKGLETLASMGFTNEQLNQAIEVNKQKVEELKALKDSYQTEEYIKELTQKNAIDIENNSKGIASLEECVVQFSALNKYMEFKSVLPKPAELPKIEEVVSEIENKDEIEEEKPVKKAKVTEVDDVIIDKITKVKEKKATKKQQLKLRLELLQEMHEETKNPKLELRIELLEEMLEVA